MRPTLHRVRHLRVLTAAACLALAGCGADDPESTPPPRDFAGVPPVLAKLHGQANVLLPGGLDGYETLIADLRGYPVVVNKWASWCAPCRGEFPIFQRVAARVAKRVAFLGVNSNDNDGQAAGFLRRYPVSYPSFKDGDARIASELGFAQAFPVTAFYDKRGKLVYTHPGPYRDDAALLADIRRYAG